MATRVTLVSGTAEVRRREPRGSEGRGGVESVQAVQPISYVDGKCNCCPYGYHIDLDFLNFCQDVADGSTLTNLKRIQRTKRKLRKSMEVMLHQQQHHHQGHGDSATATLVHTPPPDVVHSTEASRLINMVQYEQSATHRVLRDIDTSVNATLASIETVQQEKVMGPSGPTHSQRYMSSDSDDGYSYSPVSPVSSASSLNVQQTRFQAFATAQAPPAPPPRRSSLHHHHHHSSTHHQSNGEESSHFATSLSTSGRTDSMSSLSSVSTVSSEQIGGTGQYTSHASGMLNTPQPREMATAQVRRSDLRQHATTSGSTTVTTTSMTSEKLAATMATHFPQGDEPDGPGPASPSSSMSPNTTIGKASLAAIRESMAISLQRMRDLEEQVKAIPILQVRISVLKEEKRLLALQLKAKSSAASASVRSIGVGVDSVDVSPKISPRDFAYPTASSPFAPMASSPRSPGMKTPPPTMPKPSRVKTVGVGDHSIVEPYLLQPDLPTGYVLTDNQVVNEIFTSIHEKETVFMGGSLDRRLGSVNLSSSRTAKLSSASDIQEMSTASPTTHFTINQIQRTAPKHMTRSIGVGDGNVLDSSLQIHEKELRTVIIGGSGAPVGKRNVGVEVRVPTRSVGVSYSCDDARPATRTVGVNVTFDTSHLHTSLDFKGEQELRSALRGVLQRNVRSIGMQCDFTPEVMDTGVQFESFSTRSIGCGGDDCRIDVDIRQPVIQRTVGVVAKPDTTSHRVGTDKDWVLEAGTNTVPLETYNKSSNTEVKRMGTMFTNTEQILRRKTGTQTDVAVFQSLDQLRSTGCNTVPTLTYNSSCNTISPVTCHRGVNTKSSELVVENFDFDIAFDNKASNTVKEFRDMPTNTNPKDLALSRSRVECVDVPGEEVASPEPARPLTMQEQIIKRGVSQASAFLDSTSSSGSMSPTSPGGPSSVTEDGSVTRTSVETVYLPATSHKMWSSQSGGSRSTVQSQVTRSSTSGDDELTTSTGGLSTKDGGSSSKTTITRTIITGGGEMVGSGSGQGQLVSGSLDTSGGGEGFSSSSSTSTITRTITSGTSGQRISGDLDTGDGTGGFNRSTTRTVTSSDGTTGGLSSGGGQFTSRELESRDGTGGYGRTITKTYSSRGGLGSSGETKVTKTVTTSGGEGGSTSTTEVTTGPAFGTRHGLVTEGSTFTSRKGLTLGDLSGGSSYMERFGFGKAGGGGTVQGVSGVETGGSSETSSTVKTTVYSSSVEMGGNSKSATLEDEGKSETYSQETESSSMSSGTISEGTAVSELQPSELVVKIGGEGDVGGGSLSFSSSSTSSSSSTLMSSGQPGAATETVVVKRSAPTSSSKLSKNRHSDGARVSRELAMDMQGAFSGRRVGSVEDFMPDDMRRLMNIEISGLKGKSRSSGGERSISKSSRTVTTKKITQNNNGTVTVTKTITNPDGSVTTTTTTDVDIDEVGPQGQGLGKLSTGQFDLSKIMDEDETVVSAMGESQSSMEQSQQSGGIKDSGYYESSSMTTVSQSSSLPGLDFDSMGSLERRQLKSIMKKSKSDSSNPKRGISFAESVVGGTGSSSEEGASESDDDSTTSFEEGTYDGQEGDIIYQCRDDEAIAEGAPGAKMYDQNIRETSIAAFRQSQGRYELSDEMRKACEVVASYLVDSTTIQTKELNANISVVQGEWFRVSSHKLSSAHQVEDYLSSIKEISSRLLEYIVNLVDDNGNAAIHYCVSHCNFDIVGLLLDTEVCDVKRPNKAGYTPVMLATLGYIQNDEHREIIRRLFAAGDINAADEKIGQTALMLATSQCRADMVQLLLEKGANYNLQDFEGSTALMCACEHGHTAIVRLLLQAGADCNLQDSDGSTALMCACEHGHSAIVQMLLAQPDCDATLTLTDNETTALTIAMKEGHKDIGVMLYKHLNFSKPVSPHLGVSVGTGISSVNVSKRVKTASSSHSSTSSTRQRQQSRDRSVKKQSSQGYSRFISTHSRSPANAAMATVRSVQASFKQGGSPHSTLSSSTFSKFDSGL